MMSRITLSICLLALALLGCETTENDNSTPLPDTGLTPGSIGAGGAGGGDAQGDARGQDDAGTQDVTGDQGDAATQGGSGGAGGAGGQGGAGGAGGQGGAGGRGGADVEGGAGGQGGAGGEGGDGGAGGDSADLQACDAVEEGMFGDCRAALGWAPNRAGECRLVGGCPAQCDAACQAALFGSREACQRACMDEPMCGREASVDPDAANAARYEAPQANNDCRVDADCVVGGCNGEVCAAEALDGTCDAVPLPAGQCGCVSGECIWYESACGEDDPLEAEEDPRCVPTPQGTYGNCRALLPVWTPRPDGRTCVRLGGCPAQCDEACHERNFHSQRECERACLR